MVLQAAIAAASRAMKRDRGNKGSRFADMAGHLGSRYGPTWLGASVSIVSQAAPSTNTSKESDRLEEHD